MTDGWIALHRKIYSSKDFNNQLETSIFIYLLSNASHKDCEVVYRRKKIKLKRGQISIAIRDLANKFSLTFTKTKTIIDHLISTNNINQNLIKNLSIYTIVKYDKYQHSDDKKNQNLQHRTTTITTNTTSIDKNMLSLSSMTGLPKKITLPTLQDLKNKIIEKPKEKNEFEIMREKLDAEDFEKWVLHKLNS
jgi:hypothetical protein